MTTPLQPQKRVRLNVASVKGVRVWDCTVEYYDCSVPDLHIILPEGVEWLDRTAIALEESDHLMAEFERRYPEGDSNAQAQG